MNDRTWSQLERNRELSEKERIIWDHGSVMIKSDDITINRIDILCKTERAVSELSKKTKSDLRILIPVGKTSWKGHIETNDQADFYIAMLEQMLIAYRGEYLANELGVGS